ncbi:MAG: polynucleotide adenylyltransferase PcnB [Burkholderiaceae bacterium]|jgi:poly(A) polymerase|nr:polynucleotide adenylyltransferase PcnB [Burkholderiaceae bacterium]
MIRKFIGKLLGKDSAQGKKHLGKRVEVGPQAHRIDLALVDPRAINVVATLKQAGFEAYIVGGAVRDLLLGLKPKDFDVATNATPEQVKALFRRAFIIGRRFRIVHVVHGRGREHEVIEVSTFRAQLDNAAAEAVSGNERTSRAQLVGMQHAVDASGRVLRDNVWGPQIEDAARRDFTVNAMYYDPQTQIVVDYHSGIGDAQKKRLRMIGDAAARYREDPVRIIRAVRFAAKLSALGFRLDPKTAKPLAECRPLLRDVPQSRLFDEMLKLLQTGHAIASVEQLRKLGLAAGIYPLLDLAVARAREPFFKAAMQDTDRRVGEGKPVAPSFLLAALLWQDVRAAWARRRDAGEHPVPALQAAIDETFDARVGDVSGRGRLAADMREIWLMQPRFEKRTGNTPLSLVEQPRFRAGYDFLRLRADVGEAPEMLADWWQALCLASPGGREDMLEQVRAEQRKAAPPRARAPKRGGAPEAAAGGADDAAATSSAPKRRRRRRRKPAADGGAASSLPDGPPQGNANDNGQD